MSATKPSEPQPMNTRRRPNQLPNTSIASSTSTPSTSTGKRNRRAPSYYDFAWPVSFCSFSESESIRAPKPRRRENSVIATVIQEENAPVVSPSDPPIWPAANFLNNTTISKKKSACQFPTLKLKFESNNLNVMQPLSTRASLSLLFIKFQLW